MEKLQNLKHCSWISDEISVKDFQQQHLSVLKATFPCHPSKVGWQEACKEFFTRNVPENIEEQLATDDRDKKDQLEDLWDLEKMEEDCGIDQLTVPNELPSGNTLDNAEALTSRLPTNWYEGSFNDGVVPEGSGDKLQTLQHQAAELSRRTSVGDYSTLRYRTLKYFSTLRLPQEIITEPITTDFCEDVIINVRIQRPYFKKIHFKKSSNKFPSHSQELLLLGSLRLTSLRDAIDCVNDFAVHEDMSDKPCLADTPYVRTAKEEFPSGMFYINGCFFVDNRRSGAKDYSIGLRKWANRLSEIGDLRTYDMHSTRFSELKLRVGYPYLYLHQGYCEHLITFTDIRLQERMDPRQLSLYPLNRGRSSKLSVRCCACNRNLAMWVVVGCNLFSVPNAHVCDICLKLFCYDEKDKKLTQFKLYPFFDEGALETRKLQERRDNNISSHHEDGTELTDEEQLAARERIKQDVRRSRLMHKNELNRSVH